MSYALGGDFTGYDPGVTVDQIAEYTDMIGAESVENLEVARKRSTKESPAKSLAVLWVVILLIYSLCAVVFRGRVA